MARMAQLSAKNMTHGVPMSVVNRQCSSGLQAFMNVASAIRSGDIDVGMACGVESMSFNPMHKAAGLPHVDWTVMSEEAMDCLTPMGVTSENIAEKYNLSRSQLDQFAAESHRRAAAAQDEGKFVDEIVPVGNVTKDDGIRRGTTPEKLGKLKPVFKKGGSTTAGNSSQMTDGAAAVLTMSRAEAQRRNLNVMGVLRSFAVCGVPPNVMGIGPAVAIPQALKQANLTVGDVDVFEINEAFATQASWCVSELGIDPKRVNPNGGAIALGHPLGCTGARQIATLLHELKRRQQKSNRTMYGVVSMCIGTGMGAAAVFEVEAVGQTQPRARL